MAEDAVEIDFERLKPANGGNVFCGQCGWSVDLTSDNPKFDSSHIYCVLVGHELTAHREQQIG